MNNIHSWNENDNNKNWELDSCKATISHVATVNTQFSRFSWAQQHTWNVCFALVKREDLKRNFSFLFVYFVARNSMRDFYFNFFYLISLFVLNFHLSVLCVESKSSCRSCRWLFLRRNIPLDYVNSECKPIPVKINHSNSVEYNKIYSRHTTIKYIAWRLCSMLWKWFPMRPKKSN